MEQKIVQGGLKEDGEGVQSTNAGLLVKKVESMT